MSMLSAASTFAEIEAALLDSLGYEEDGSAARAAACLTACKCWLVRSAASLGHGAASVTLNAGFVEKELEAARQWLQARAGTNPGVRHLGPLTRD